MTWDSNRAYGMRHLASHGLYRFSQDVHDLSCHVNGTARRETNMPNPYFDVDFVYCGVVIRANETEITSESASFPTAGVAYYTNFYFQRWANYGGVWIWDPNAGTLSYDEQLSEQYPVGDKWDTTYDWGPNTCCAFLGNGYYPYQSQPGVSSMEPGAEAPAETVPVVGTVGAAAPQAAAAAPEREAFALSITTHPDEWVALPDLSRGLEAYARDARAMASELVAGGPARGIVTFSHPVGSAELANLAAAGIEIETVEAVSTLAPDGTRWTISDEYRPAFWGSFTATESEFGVKILGVVSAEVTVPDATVLSRANASPHVWLIDLTLEQILRSRPQLTDVVMNDLYWRLAGWEYQRPGGT